MECGHSHHLFTLLPHVMLLDDAAPLRVGCHCCARCGCCSCEQGQAMQLLISIRYNVLEEGVEDVSCLV